MIVADSSALISLLIKTDRNHQKALSIAQDLKKNTTAVTVPADVFSETVNLIGKKFSHEKATNAGKFLMNSDTFVIESSTEQVRERALKLFEKQPSSVSFTDCIVMVMADHYDAKEIFGFDDVFKKNGYKRLGID